MASGNGISGLLNFKLFSGSMPPDPPRDWRHRRASGLPPHKFLATAMMRVTDATVADVSNVSPSSERRFQFVFRRVDAGIQPAVLFVPTFRQPPFFF